MAISTMYPAKAGSPKTVLAIQISASATQITVADASVLPSAPNICVLGSDSNAEIVSYSAKNGNVLTGVVRGLGGTVASVLSPSATTTPEVPPQPFLPPPFLPHNSVAPINR